MLKKKKITEKHLIKSHWAETTAKRRYPAVFETCRYKHIPKYITLPKLLHEPAVFAGSGIVVLLPSSSLTVSSSSVCVRVCVRWDKLLWECVCSQGGAVTLTGSPPLYLSGAEKSWPKPHRHVYARYNHCTTVTAETIDQGYLLSVIYCYSFIYILNEIFFYIYFPF